MSRIESTDTSVTSCCANLYELPLTRLLLGSSFHPGGLALTEQLARSVALGPGDRVLDLASGRGDTALHLASKYGAVVVGLDFSRQQVEEANRRARDAGLAQKVSFIQGDAASLPFKDELFDIVFCECALCVFPERNDAVREARRVLKPRGKFALSDVVLNRPVPDNLQSLMGHILCITGALSEAGYSEALRKGGFQNVRLRDASHTLSELITQIEKRLTKISKYDESNLANFNAKDVNLTLHAARDFIASAGVGYATFVASS